MVQTATQINMRVARMQALSIELEPLSKTRCLLLTLGSLLPISAIGHSTILGFLEFDLFFTPPTISLFLVARIAIADRAGNGPVILVTGTSFVFSLIITFVRTDRDQVYNSGHKLKLRCVFVPCTLQDIEEWDQAFSLLAALFLALYEFGPKIVRVAKKGIQSVYRTWMPAAW